MKIIRFARQMAHDDEGVTAIEYGLIAALIAVAIIVSVRLIGVNLDAVFVAVAASIASNILVGRFGRPTPFN